MKAIILSLLFVAQSAHSSWILKSTRSGKDVTPVGLSEISKGAEVTPQKLRSFPRFHQEYAPSDSEVYEEVLWPQDQVPENFAPMLQSLNIGQGSNSELRTIVEQGPAANRICLTFLGDGYTLSEKEKFFNDVSLLVDDLFNGKTFVSYKSLFNVYAVFVPSKDSGITDIDKKDTAFGLYRSPAGSKRAIMPGNTPAIDSAITIAPKTDFPIIIANDEFYGGLGGEYAITTSSRRSGKIVLRHELGHNFGDVGEEYDGGSVYRGANSSSSSKVPWTQWMKSANSAIQDARFLGGAYVWKNLSQGSVLQKFNFPNPSAAGDFWFEVQISSVGWENLSDVEVLLDGSPLTINGAGTEDRSFFNTKLVQGIKPGQHTLEIREVKHDGNNILAFANLYAYAPQYDFGSTVSAYKTYDSGQNLSYRPTHDKCIMRDMLSENFCSVDQENMWLQFLNRVRLIDAVNITARGAELQHIPGLPIAVSWYQKVAGNWHEIVSAKNQELLEPSLLVPGVYKVSLKLSHPEIRKPSSHLTDEMEFSIP